MSTWIRGGMVAVLLVVVFSACQHNGSGNKVVEQNEAGALGGKELFLRYCSSCHGANGKGDGAIARLLKNAPPDLTTFAERREGKFSYTELARYIDGRQDVSAHGTRIMPVWGQQFGRSLPDAEVREEIVNGTVLELVFYLESLQQ